MKLQVLGRRLRDEGEEGVAADAHPLPFDFHPRAAPERERFLVAELDPDLLDHAHREVVDELHPLRVRDLEHRHPAQQGGQVDDGAVEPGRGAGPRAGRRARGGGVRDPARHAASRYIRGRRLAGS